MWYEYKMMYIMHYHIITLHLYPVISIAAILRSGGINSLQDCTLYMHANKV